MVSTGCRLATVAGVISAFALGTASAAEPADRRVEEQVTAPVPTGGRGAPPPRVGRTPGQTADRGAGLGDLGLVRQGDGSYLYVDPHGRFTAKFAADGTVHFADRWRRPSHENRQRGSCCGKPPGGMPGINPFYGMHVTGPTEWILKIRGVDIFTNAKDDLLDQTRELRVKIAVAYNLRLLDTRLRELEPELLALWSDHSIPVERRRALIFQRWDECDERFELDPGNVPADAILAIDQARVDTAEDARRRIEAFVERHAPRTSRHAYGRQELRRLNASRVSREPFAPYRSREPKRRSNPR